MTSLTSATMTSLTPLLDITNPRCYDVTNSFTITSLSDINSSFTSLNMFRASTTSGDVSTKKELHDLSATIDILIAQLQEKEAEMKNCSAEVSVMWLVTP